MRKQEVIRSICKGLDGATSAAGFAFKRRDMAFLRRTLFGSQSLGVPFWDYNPDFQFSLNITIRIDAAQKLFNEFSGIEDHPLGFTTMTRLEFFVGESARISVLDETGIAVACERLSELLRGRIIPFLDAHQDVRAVDRLMNGDEATFDMSAYPYKAWLGVIVAHLASATSLDFIEAKYRSVLSLPLEAEHPFNRLVSFLKTRTET